MMDTNAPIVIAIRAVNGSTTAEIRRDSVGYIRKGYDNRHRRIAWDLALAHLGMMQALAEKGMVEITASDATEVAYLRQISAAKRQEPR